MKDKIIAKPVIMIDLGAVYFTHGSRTARSKLAKKLRIPEETLRGALSRGTHAQKYYNGKIEAADFWKATAKFLKLPESKMKEIEHIWFSSYKPQKGMRQLVRKLRKNNKVVVLSGNMKERVAFLDRKYGYKKEFHQHHYSFDYGINKPDVRLFKRAVKKMKVNPKDCIVIDDMEDFIAGVKRTGAKAIVFKDAEQVKKELIKLGVVL